MSALARRLEATAGPRAAQWQIPAEHVGVPAGQSCLLRHWTQADIWQNGDAVGQSVSAAQITQRPPALQTGVAVFAHCAPVRHSTHDDVAALQ
jgi:hypothetical protein